jgi:ketosteroid isomerase-like protein
MTTIIRRITRQGYASGNFVLPARNIPEPCRNKGGGNFAWACYFPSMMRKAILLTALLLSVGFTGSSQKAGNSVDGVSQEIIALERSAIDRYITLDPQGYLDLYAPEVTYFDPKQEKRVDGLDAMKTLLEPMKNMKVAIKDMRYEMIAPQVQPHGDISLLTFRVINYGKPADRPETVLARWNSTEVYSRIAGKWRIIHSHWSYTKPELKQTGLQPQL